MRELCDGTFGIIVDIIPNSIQTLPTLPELEAVMSIANALGKRQAPDGGEESLTRVV